MRKSSIELLKSKEHLKIDFDGDGYVIEFRLNTGKGTSPIRIPIEFMEQIINIFESGPKAIIEQKNIVDFVKDSLAFDLDENGEEIVVFRTRYGRGSKIHKIRKNEYEQVIEILKQINKDIPGVIAKYEDPNH